MNIKKMENNKRFGVGILAWIFNPDFSKILLLKRNKEKREKYGFDWGGIGGKLEFGEFSKDAILREIREEIGIKLDESKLKLLLVKEFPEFTKEVHGFSWFYSYILPENAKIRINEESDEYKWFDIKNLPDSMIDSKEDILKILNIAREKFS